MRNCPGPERGIFCRSILDLISRSSLVLFSMLCTRNYRYNKGPVIVDNIMILTIHGGLFCIIFLQSIPTGWVINIDFISIHVIVLKIEIMYHCILKYDDILIFVIFQIEISSIIFSQISNRAFFIFSVTMFWGIQNMT